MAHSPAGHADLWLWASCTDDRLRGLYQRHYSSDKATRRRGRPIDTPNQLRMVGPGEYRGMLTADCRAGFIWRLSKHRKDGQTGVECTLFRNEGTSAGCYASCLILGAMSWAWRAWPGARLFTFVDPRKVRSTNPGYCFLMAGWRRVPGLTKRGLVVLEVTP